MLSPQDMAEPTPSWTLTIVGTLVTSNGLALNSAPSPRNLIEFVSGNEVDVNARLPVLLRAQVHHQSRVIMGRQCARHGSLRSSAIWAPHLALVRQRGHEYDELRLGGRVAQSAEDILRCGGCLW